MTESLSSDTSDRKQPGETGQEFLKGNGGFEAKVEALRRKVANLDKYPAYHHVKPVVNTAVLLQEYLQGRAFPVITGMRTQDNLPPELRAAFDDFHVYSDALDKYYYFVFTAEQYPLIFELLARRDAGLERDTKLDDDLMRRVKLFAEQTLAMLLRGRSTVAVACAVVCTSARRPARGRLARRPGVLKSAAGAHIGPPAGLVLGRP